MQFDDTETNPRGCSCAVRLINSLYDIRPFRVNSLMDLSTLQRCIADLFADTYSDLSHYKLHIYVDKRLRFGIYNVMVLNAAAIFEGALITVVPVSHEPRRLPFCSYDYKVEHMVHSRSRFIKSNSNP